MPSTARFVSGTHSRVATICGAARSPARPIAAARRPSSRHRRRRSISRMIQRPDARIAIPIVKTSPARKSRANRADRRSSLPVGRSRPPRHRPHDPRQQRHARVDVGKEHLRNADPREDVGDRADPRAGPRNSERPQEKNHPGPRRDPVQEREEPHRHGERQDREERPKRVHRTGVGVRQQRSAARHLRHPQGQSAARIGVVNRLFHRQVVDEQIPPREVSPEEKGIGVDAENHEGEEKRRDQPGLARRRIRAQVRRARSLARSAAAAASEEDGSEARDLSARDALLPVDR